jgi:hypothetical protein
MGFTEMAPTLARHCDIWLTMGVYTHIGLHEQTVAIGSLPVPPGNGHGDGEKPRCKTA